MDDNSLEVLRNVLAEDGVTSYDEAPLRVNQPLYIPDFTDNNVSVGDEGSLQKIDKNEHPHRKHTEFDNTEIAYKLIRDVNDNTDFEASYDDRNDEIVIKPKQK